jgi:hypothetical protein
MAYRNGNYTAFYVDSPFNQSNLRANSTHDFVYYRQLQMWKAKDNLFPFNDSHNKTYNVRDDSDWETTLKPRLRERLRNSKNIILFLSSITKNSMALREEIDYGINNQGLPVIIVYPDFSEKSDIVTSTGIFRTQITALWDKLPIFRDSKNCVPTIHMPLKQELIKDALNDSKFMVNSKIDTKNYYFNI